MGNDAIQVPGITITAEPLCTSASETSPIPLSIAPVELASGAQNYSPLSSLFSSDALQSLRKQTQLFSSAKDVFGAEGADAIPLTCSQVSVSGTGSFGDVTVGFSQSRGFTVTNNCDCPVNYSIGGAPSGFSISGSTGGSIAAHSFISFSVTFNPQSEQSYYGSVSVSPGSSISVSGRGVRRP